MRYLYLPFSHYQADDSWAGTVDRYRSKGHTVIEHSRTWKPLRALGANDVLIIMGHGGKGASGRGFLSVKRVDLHGNETWPEMTANDLAIQLESDGLSKNHRIVKSLTCYGGGAWKLDGNNHQLYGKDNDYFAKLLAMALGLRGYNNIVVGGYPGTVGSTTDQKMVFFRVINNGAGNYNPDPDGEVGTSTTGYIQWFDSHGNDAAP
ncbi:hypothetical protein FE249_00015 [Acidiphilium multivorum]|uniref:hypothetical protein n=1 Tax=Acidiphilium multivorum TaxID=62140 RepID=UPI001F4C292C|nr:hypothetical protein [Acidiphilium multivorum]UNC12720.1 hypothetical protein FE249_00015 [Acidiphilium multivorum]